MTAPNRKGPAPEKLFADRGPKGGWMFRPSIVYDTQHSYTRDDLIPNAALALPEVAALVDDMLEYLRGQSPDLCSGGHYNRDLQARIAALRGEGQP